MFKDKRTVNLVVYNELRSRNYTQNSILAAMDCSRSKLKTCMKHCTAEETRDVEGELDESQLKLSQKGEVNIDMKDAMGRFHSGESVRSLADEYGVKYSTLWNRIDVLINKPK
ncbi:MAG: hypothetical protein OCC46_06580 [Pseudodesulfovibrio sp.]